MSSRLSPGPSGSCIQTCLESAYLLVKSHPSKAEMPSVGRGALAVLNPVLGGQTLTVSTVPEAGLGCHQENKEPAPGARRGGDGEGDAFVVACRVCTLHIYDLDWSC